MHKSFYKLDREPFDLQPDPMFLWMGEKYKEALAVLRYGIIDNKGFLLLTGESGVGKTTLLRALTESLPPDVVWALITNPDMPKMEMFNIIGKSFGMDKEYNSKVEFMLDFGTFAQERHAENKKMLLIVDSAHLLSQENIEELRLLSNIEQDDAKLIHIFFSAQPSFNATLTRPRNSAIRQRLSLTHTIEPLTAQETFEYIGHRLSVAGVENHILTEKASRSVHLFSSGIPKKINIICRQLLIEGAKQGRRVIDQGAVQKCMQRFAHSEDSKQMDFIAAGPMPGRGGKGKSFSQRLLAFGIGALALVLIIFAAGYFSWSQRNKESRSGSTTVTAASNVSGSAWADKGDRSASESLPAPAVKPASPPSEPASSTPTDSPKDIINRIAARPVASPVNNTPDTTGVGDSLPQESATAIVTISPTTGLATMQPTAQATAGNETVQTAPVMPAATKPSTSEETASPTGKQDGVEEIIINPDQKEAPMPAAATHTVPPPAQKASQTALPVSLAPVAAPPSGPFDAKTLPQLKAILPLRANSYSLTSEGNAALTNFVRKFKQAGQGKIEVRGYVSSNNESKKHTRLSIRRAEAVRAMLLHAGIDQASIVVRGMGVENPLASNDTPEGRDKNRRVELEIIP